MFGPCALQAGLFVYDIFWVFFTPVMVSVAKSFDAPIKVCTPDRSRSFYQCILRLQMFLDY